MNAIMENTLSRPKNEDLGRALRDKRIPVQVTAEEKEELERAASEMGVGASTYLRLKALEAARNE